MSLEVCLICDACGALIDAGKTGAKIREEAKRRGIEVSLPGGKDRCTECIRLDRRAE